MAGICFKRPGSEGMSSVIVDVSLVLSGNWSWVLSIWDSSNFHKKGKKENENIMRTGYQFSPTRLSTF